MNIPVVWYITKHEHKNNLRLVRTQVFLCVALSLCTLYYVSATLMYMQGANQIPMLGVMSPRYILSLLSGSFVGLFGIGLSLLLFDQLSRDANSRIRELIDSKPVTDLEFVVGRIFGSSLTMGIPMIVFLSCIVGWGIIAETFFPRLGEPVVLLSVCSFLGFDLLPNFLFFGSLIIFLNTICRSRLFAFLMTVTCICMISG